METYLVTVQYIGQRLSDGDLAALVAKGFTHDPDVGFDLVRKHFAADTAHEAELLAGVEFITATGHDLTARCACGCGNPVFAVYAVRRLADGTYD